jgi:NAD+ diphosphatase
MKTNIFKFCPNCQSDKFLFNQINRYNCSDCGFEYYHNIAGAVAVIIEQNNKILLTRRNNEPKRGMLDLPGGFVDLNESAEQAVVREIKEELNLDLDINYLQYLQSEPNDYTYKNIPYQTLDIVFSYTLIEAVSSFDKIEIQEILWVDKADVELEKIGFDSLRKALKEYLA